MVRFDDLVVECEAAGPVYDEVAPRLGVFAGIAWLGLEEALAFVEHRAQAVSGPESVCGTAVGLHQAELVLETGLV